MSGTAKDIDWSEAVAQLSTAQKILLLCHTSPDPDAYGIGRRDGPGGRAGAWR